MEKKTINNNTRMLRSTMSAEFQFSGCYFADSRLNFCKWNLTISFIARPLKKGEKKEDLQKKLSVSYCKLTTWIQYFLSDIFMVDINDQKTVESLFAISMDNPVMMTPGVPSDGLLVQLLHSKVSALTQGDLLIEDANLAESDSKLSYYFSLDSAKYDLPAQKDFVGAAALHAKPWWERYDCDTYDLEVPKGVKRKDMMSDVDSSGFLKDLEKGMYDSLSGKDVDGKAGEIVEFPTGGARWKPEET